MIQIQTDRNSLFYTHHRPYDFDVDYEQTRLETCIPNRKVSTGLGTGVLNKDDV